MPKSPVFYNPRTKLSRDVGVLFLKATFTKSSDGISICEPLAGCGVRGLRYAKETHLKGSFLLNDHSLLAYRYVKRNIKLNRLRRNVTATHKEANLLLSHASAMGERFDFIDIDPFGSPLPYIDSALNALKRVSYVALTATDTAALCGTAKRACLRKYAATALYTEYKHEIGLRILVASLATAATRNGAGMEPLLTHSTEHYMRVYARLTRRTPVADATAGQLGYIMHCPACLHREVRLGMAASLPEYCPRCNGVCQRGGPLWCGPILDTHLLKSIAAQSENCDETYGNATRLLRVLNEEANMPPTFFNIDVVCRLYRISSPPIAEVVQTLRSWGFGASRTHFHPKGVKSDASVRDLADAVGSVQRDKARQKGNHKSK